MYRLERRGSRAGSRLGVLDDGVMLLGLQVVVLTPMKRVRLTDSEGPSLLMDTKRLSTCLFTSLIYMREKRDAILGAQRFYQPVDTIQGYP